MFKCLGYEGLASCFVHESNLQYFMKGLSIPEIAKKKKNIYIWSRYPHNQNLNKISRSAPQKLQKNKKIKKENKTSFKYKDFFYYLNFKSKIKKNILKEVNEANIAPCVDTHRSKRTCNSLKFCFEFEQIHSSMKQKPINIDSLRKRAFATFTSSGLASCQWFEVSTFFLWQKTKTLWKYRVLFKNKRNKLYFSS